MNLETLFDLAGKTAVVTGGAGVLGSAMCRALARLGVRVAILGIGATNTEQLADDIRRSGGEAIGISCDVLDKAAIEIAAARVLQTFGSVDILINAAGGNKKQATTSLETPFFDLPADALQWVFNLNIIGTILPCQVFGKIMASQGQGVILNISSMNSFQPLTRVPAYSAAKAGVSNFTQWLAVHMAQEYTPNIRVNAIAPGFFMTEQNRFLLTDEHSGELTPRGQTIIDHTPMGRYGDPEDLLGTVIWLLSDASRFVTGTIVPIDGGFSAFSGV
ncbi:MAG: SDR family oxidoreductase [Anaerolineae bacterium]|nr:SDR family oxidoreductase [Anaerolineae bacterium]